MNMVDQEVYFRVTDLIKHGEVRGGLDLVDELMRKGHDLREFLNGLTEHFRNLLVAKSTGATTLIDAAEPYRQRYVAEAAAFTVPDLLRLLRLVNGTEAALRWSVQPRFRVEADLVQMISLPRAPEVAELLQRIDELKKKLSDGTPHRWQEEKAAPRPAASPVAVQPPVAIRRHPPAASAGGGLPRPEHLPAYGEVLSRWQEFLGEVRMRKISLWSTLENTRLLGVDGSVVRLACDDEFQASMVMKNKETIADLFAHVFHMRPRVVTEITRTHDRRPAAPSGSEGTIAESGSREEHPVIAAMKRELGAEPI
jgi:DNA polymerase-3 subunit gamma/tau